MRVSVVLPVFNEKESLRYLHQGVQRALALSHLDYEIIYVNDGSDDGSDQLLDQLAEEDPHVGVVHFRRNYGQTAALSAGFDCARGDVIVTLDSDLQNDPADIPQMLDKLEEGYDLVHGWRQKRQDAFLNRRLPSLIANRLIACVTGFPVRDLGCTLKVMRRHVADELNLYGELHRFIPVLAHWQGARCAEVKTNHRARQFGQTKYGLSRTFRVLLDLVTVKYLIQYSTSPMRLFGSIGLLCSGASFALGIVVVALKLFWRFDISGNPLLYVCLFGLLLGLQFFSLGLLGETNVRIYYESQGRKPYSIRRVANRPRQGDGEHRDAA